MTTLAFIQNISPFQILLLMLLGLLLFGKRLPEVGRSLGKGIVEFKKGLKSVEDDVEDASNRPSSRPRSPELPDDRQRSDERRYDDRPRYEDRPRSYEDRPRSYEDNRVSRSDPVEQPAPPPNTAG
ncbi:MAG: twin-arginine translocase TatA/TatE family subunit [Limisphaerales bacterium]